MGRTITQTMPKANNMIKGKESNKVRLLSLQPSLILPFEGRLLSVSAGENLISLLSFG